jgi:signal transduction histidine kinase
MAGSYGARLRAAALGVVGIVALVAGARTDHGTSRGWLLAATGGFALGIAASLVLVGARAEGRAEGERLAAVRPVPSEPPAGATALQRAGEGGVIGQGAGATAVARATVAAVAHDMSNPLASLRSNLEWLRDAVEEGRLDPRGDAAEVREVLRDAREAAERLRVDVGTLRAAGRGEPTAPPHA